MKRIWAPLLIAFMLFAASHGRAAAPTLNSGTRIQAGGSNIDVGSHAKPTVADWTNDGKKDLILGQFTNGKIRNYLNTGSASSPAFSGHSFVKSGGVDITMGYG